MFQFQCPACSRNILADKDQAGSEVLCPSCQTSVQVPLRDPQQEPQRSDFLVDDIFGASPGELKEANPYRPPEDDVEPLDTDDEKAIEEENLQEQRAILEALQKRAESAVAEPKSGSTNLTTEEKTDRANELLDLSVPEEESKSLWEAPVTPPDNIELDGHLANSVSARCDVCGSRCFVHQEKAGQTFQCPDCGSEVQVPEENENTTSPLQKQAWEKWIQKDSRGEDEADEVDLLSQIPELDSEEYGLEPVSEKPAATFLTIDGNDMLEEVDGLEILDESGLEELDKKPQTSGQVLQPSFPLQAAPRPVKEKSELESTSALMDEIEAEKAAKFELLPWPEHIFGFFINLPLLARLFLVAGLMTLTFSLFDFSGSLLLSDNLIYLLMGYLTRFPFFLLAPVCAIGIGALGQIIIDNTAMGRSDYEPKGSFSFWEWATGSFFTSFSFVLCGIPGVLLGFAIHSLVADPDSETYWLIPSLFSAFGMMLAPYPMLSSLFNESPFKLSSKKVQDSFKQQQDAWIEFYLAAVPCSVLVCVFWLIGMTTAWIYLLIMSVLLTTVFALYFRILGRLLGRIANPKRKKKKSTDK